MIASDAYLAILKRSGVVLIAVGLLDVGLMIYAIANHSSYSSSLNIFAVIAGVFLLKGSLRVASLVRRFGALLLAAMACAAPLLPLIFPFDLALTAFRLDPWKFAAWALIPAAMLGVVAWVVLELGRGPVLAAMDERNLKRSPVRTYAAIGGLVAVLVLGAVIYFTNGDAANHAKFMAAHQLGPGYQFHVTSLQWQRSGGVARYTVTVTAWNNREIRTVPEQWTQ